MGTLANSIDEMADSMTEAERGPLAITDMNFNIIFANDIWLALLDKKLDDVLGTAYYASSYYPESSVYDPVMALREGRESEIMYMKELRCYLKGEASYLTDNLRNRIGYIITSTDVTDFMEQQEQLKKAVEEAKLANEHKGNFLARMSHEIRTPMNAIIGMTGIVKKKLSSKSYSIDDVLTNISQIETSSHHLLGLLNDILDLSKIEAGKIELVMEDMDLLKLAQTVITIIQPKCDEKNITFDTHFDIPSNILYRGDSLRLRQVLINLLGNAVKFTPDKGTVSYQMVCKEQKNGKSFIHFSVKDTGIGIPEKAQLTLFQPFQQADNQITQKYGGTGLGLAISKNIVQMMGGDIAINSVEGSGSDFFFNLWLEETGAPQETESAVKDVTGLLKGKKALLVDDVDINRIIAMDMLENTGITIVEAGDGAEAVKIFRESAGNEYDIIYMDVQMPIMNGHDAAKVIRAMERPDAKTVPIVALTANTFKEDIDKAIASGMNAHLAKPMDRDKTIEVTLKMLGM
jgi:signal transduction histidine kinase/ActR/RegA family two-component response regulator